MNFSQEPWFPGFVTGTLALIAVIVAAIFQNKRERRKDVDASKSPTPPTTQQVWERLDRSELVLGALVKLFTEVADQWQGDHPPILSKRHVKIVADAGYLPPEWEPQVTED